MKFDQSFKQLPAYLFETVAPTPLKGARLIHKTDLQSTLGLDEVDLKSWLNGEKRLSGDQTIATRYAGHQFGVWAGQLGDGRAISLGEILVDDERYEVQIKGAGLTPFSRMGDGKAVIRSSVREYLCSEAMYALGIPTSRVLAILTGEDDVYREQIEKSAIVARVFPSNLRFGHFELCFHFGKDDELKALIDYARVTFFEGMSTEGMLREVVKRTATLMAHWQSVGFCHGVMNTDNMSLLGITIDFGPFGFLEDTSLNYICNHSDHRGRYAFSQQPSVAMWNLERLLVCFVKEIPREKLQDILNEYPQVFEKEYLALARKKLGFKKPQDQDFQIFIHLMQTLNQHSIDYTFFFRELCSFKRTAFKEVLDYYGQRKELLEWIEVYKKRIQEETTTEEELKKINPKYVLRNYIAQEVIEDVERGGAQKLEQWLKILYHPFDEHSEFSDYARPTPPEHKNYQISCSS